MMSIGTWPLSTLLPLIIAAIIAGTVRGYSGFGAGLIFMPTASAIIDPKLAVTTFFLLDSIITLPLVPAALRAADWPTITPAAIFAAFTVPVGTYVLINTDITTLRWMIVFFIFAMLALLVSGWRYSGKPHFTASAGVGALAGFLSGVSQVPGPPIVTYWMAGPLPPQTVRANLITYFALASVFAGVAYFVGGLFNQKALELMLIIAPVYALAVWFGANRFHPGAEKRFRYVVYALVAFSGFTGIPSLDVFLRGYI